MKLAVEAYQPFVRGCLAAALYVNDVLQLTVLPYLVGRQHIFFRQDNARPHIARRAVDLFQEAGSSVATSFSEQANFDHLILPMLRHAQECTQAIHFTGTFLMRCTQKQ